MQRGIGDFFKKLPSADKKKPMDSPLIAKKRKAMVISSDEEDIPASPQVPQKSREHKKSRKDEKQLSSADKKNKAKTPTPKKDMKRIDPKSIFGGETKRVEAKKPVKPKELAVLELEDADIDKSLMEIDLDESLLVEQKSKENGKDSLNIDETVVKENTKEMRTPQKQNGKDSRNIDETVVKEITKEKRTPSKQNGKDSPNIDETVVKENTKEKRTPQKNKEADKTPIKDKINKNKRTPSKKPSKGDKHDKKKSTPTKTKENGLETEKLTKSQELIKNEKLTPPSAKKPKKDDSHIKEKKPKSTPKVKKEPADLESSVLSDEERHERKRMSAILYQKYKNRTSVINPGCKEVPKGKPNCLAGLNFLVTGILESLERDEAASIIKEFGGKVMSTVGKRLNYLIVGEEAGPKKLAQADEFKIKILSEDDFFDLIREKSGEAKSTNGSHKLEENPSTSPKKKKNPIKEIKVKKEKSTSPQERTPKLPELNNNKDIQLKTENTKDLQPIKQEPAERKLVDEDMMAWVDKYKPTSVKEIIGQQGAASNVTKLMNWLSKWYINHDGKNKLQKPNPWAKNDDGAFFKAALLSGPPGIGKTTTATLVAKELGFDAVEFNASDTRSKRLLKEEVSELLSNKSLYGYFHGDAQAVSKKHVLLMDEVDGMAGNEDRGGIQELIALIKESHVPIICMCNDRNHQKMRSLVNYCYDLRFNKPRVEQIKGRIMSICFKENVKLEPSRIVEIIAATNNDIRQSINHISMLSAGKNLNLKSDKDSSKTAQKDLKIGPWESTRRIFSAEEHKSMSLNDKCDLFFHDYSLTPLFVQQNYLQCHPAGDKKDLLSKVASAADSLSLGDLVDKRIRSNNAWSLLPAQAVLSCALPGSYMSGSFHSVINFPGWLGKNSRSNKRNRLAQEIHDHTRIRTSGSRLSIRMDYAPFLLDKIVRPLKQKANEGIEEALSVMKEYHLLREDIDSLIELTTWPGKKSQFDAVDGRVKAALTRAYNKEVLAYSYSAAAGIKKKKAQAVDEEGDMDGIMQGEEGDEGGTTAVVDSDEEKDNDSLENDGLIKAKKAAAAKSSKSSSTTAANKKSSNGSGNSKPKASTSKSKK